MFCVCRDKIFAGLMLAHRLQRWANIKPALGQCLVLAGYNICNYVILMLAHRQRLWPSNKPALSIVSRYVEPISVYRWPNVHDVGPTLHQHRRTFAEVQADRPPCSVDTAHLTTAGLMLVHRRRRWPSIKPAM